MPGPSDWIVDYLKTQLPLLKKHPLLATALLTCGVITGAVLAYAFVDLLYKSRLDTLSEQVKLEKAKSDVLSASSKAGASPANADSVSRTYYGYFRRYDKEGVGTETVVLSFSRQSRKVHGVANGEVVSSGEVVPKSWSLDGFSSGDNLFLSYVTDASQHDPSPIGIGVYQLRKIDKGYSGSTTSMSCQRRAFFECPYVLAPNKIPVDDVRNKWPNLFAQTCQPRDFTPDSSLPFACGKTAP